jgi:DNA-binding NarL/FixJ family response regulator
MDDDAKDRMIHVALVEDDVHFQNAFLAAMQAARDMKLVGVASTRADGLRLLTGMPADVLVVDLGLPDGSGIEVISASLTQWPNCGVMVSTAFGDEAHVMRSIEAGAAGYLLKDSRPETMLDEIRSLNSGGSPISPLIARQILTRFRNTRAPQPDFTRARIRQAPGEPAARATDTTAAILSAREQQVLELITKGYTADECAALMQVSRHTVLTFVRRIYAKLNVTSRSAAIFEARQQGILPG